MAPAPFRKCSAVDISNMHVGLQKTDDDTKGHDRVGMFDEDFFDRKGQKALGLYASE